MKHFSYYTCRFGWGWGRGIINFIVILLFVGISSSQSRLMTERRLPRIPRVTLWVQDGAFKRLPAVVAPLLNTYLAAIPKLTSSGKRELILIRLFLPLITNPSSNWRARLPVTMRYLVWDDPPLDTGEGRRCGSVVVLA